MKPKGRLRANNGDALMPALLAGLGIADLPEFIVKDALADGSLERVLTDWLTAQGSLYLVTPPGGPRPARVEALGDFLSERLARTQDRIPQERHGSKYDRRHRRQGHSRSRHRRLDRRGGDGRAGGAAGGEARRSRPGALAAFEAIERRFAPQARIAVLVAGASGLYMLYRLDAWDRFRAPAFWWMHAMVCVWLIFALLLFVLEPLILHRRLAQWGARDPDAALAALQIGHWILLA